MQVESVPASASLSEALISTLPVPPSESAEATNAPLSLTSEDTEKPTFHIMQPPPPAAPPIVSNEVPIAPAPPTYTQLVAVPIASDQSITVTTPTATIKQTKRGSRASHINKQISRSPAKQATLLARPSTGKTSCILPQPQKTVLLSNQMTPLVPKPISANVPIVKPSAANQSQGFTTYLVVDGNQGQLVQVANDGQKPITFRNQAGQILQATPITVVAAANQPVIPAYQTNGDVSILPNSTQIHTFPQQQQQQATVTPIGTQQSHQNSQTVTTVRTSSTIDMQRTTLTSDTTTMTTQQLTGMTQIPATTSLLNGCNIVTHQPSLLQPNPIMPTSILNGSTVQSHGRELSPIHNENDSSLDDTSGLDGSVTPDTGLSLSLSQLARKANHRHRRSSSSSLSKKKRGRPRLYERDPFTNKPIKCRPMPEGTELSIPNVTTTTTTLLIPGQTTTTTTFNNLHPHTNGGASLIFPNQSINHTTTIPVNNPSLLQQQQQQQQQQYSYPSLLSGNVSSTNMLAAPTMNIFSVNNNNNISSCSSSYSYSNQPTTIIPPPSTPITTTSTNGLSRSYIPPITQTIENHATIPLKNLQISSTSSPTTSSPRPSTNASSTTTVPNVVQLNPSPIKSLNQTQNSDIVVHYIGGFVIRESSHPFPADENDDHTKELNNSIGKEKENHSFNDTNSDLGSDQLRCTLCKKVDFSERFFNQEKKFCSRSCSMKSSKIAKTINGKNPDHIKTPSISEPIRMIENSIPQQSIESNHDEPISLPPDHGLPTDPSKWTVFQVGEFVARLTNNTIREAFYESEMDGQALLLMTQEHLRDTMKIKLGPSLIISSEIAKLRERAKAFTT
ncbi:unnamed protein product [Rotaria socialis]|uniref:Uncharacterized protein n=1 Tax=Rotaria socialis TaxID=392032 RepID=A0A818GHT7_9BILA|nr:unnamed protein product [Rotaria socialis]CAF4776339.1 unnamed protein product [Rotaria socialis]